MKVDNKEYKTKETIPKKAIAYTRINKKQPKIFGIKFYF